MLLLAVSIVFLVLPLVLMLFWVSHDERGSIIEERKAKNLSSFFVMVILCYAIAAGTMIAYHILHGDYNSPHIIIIITWATIAIITITYPVSLLKNTRLEGSKLNMWDHLNVRKEVIFPWEYNPVATNVAGVYFICGLLILALALFYVFTYFVILSNNEKLNWVIPLCVFILGAFIGYVILKPKKA